MARENSVFQGTVTKGLAGRKPKRMTAWDRQCVARAQKNVPPANMNLGSSTEINHGSDWVGFQEMTGCGGRLPGNATVSADGIEFA